MLGEHTTRKLAPQASQSCSKNEIIRLPPMGTVETWEYNGPPSSGRWHGKIPTALTCYLICVSVWLVGEKSSSVEAAPVINRQGCQKAGCPITNPLGHKAERDQAQQAEISNTMSAYTSKYLTQNPVLSTKAERWPQPISDLTVGSSAWCLPQRGNVTPGSL